MTAPGAVLRWAESCQLVRATQGGSEFVSRGKTSVRLLSASEPAKGVQTPCLHHCCPQWPHRPLGMAKPGRPCCGQRCQAPMGKRTGGRSPNPTTWAHDTLWPTPLCGPCRARAILCRGPPSAPPYRIRSSHFQWPELTGSSKEEGGGRERTTFQSSPQTSSSVRPPAQVAACLCPSHPLPLSFKALLTPAAPRKPS